jgi:PAS domain S-box-containing protein
VNGYPRPANTRLLAASSRVTSSLSMIRLCRAGLGLLLLALTTLAGLAASPKRVLMVDPFGRDVPPSSVALSAFRTVLARDFGERVEFYEMSLDRARFQEPEAEGPFVQFLESRIANRPIDLVATTGGPGMDFVKRHHKRLFPATPIVLIGGPPVTIQDDWLTGMVTQVTVPLNLPSMVEDILQLQPQTTNIAVVFGASALETATLQQCRREFRQFTNRVTFTWLNDLPLERILDQCAHLPPRSFILHGSFFVDAAGVLREKDEALRRLHEVANAPVFAYFASELGLGAIGGRLFQDTEVGAQAARAASRILRGESPGSIPLQMLAEPIPVYDWRELRRWDIPEARLPIGSEVRFREPGLWQLYRWPIAGLVSFCLFQAALIISLLVNRAKRRQGEEALARLLRQNELILNSAAEGILGLDLQGNHLFVNPAAARMLGYEPQELLGRHSHRLWHHTRADGSPYPEKECKICASFAGGTAHRESTEVFWRKDGTSFPVEYASTPIREEGRLLGAVVTFEDMTERKRADAELLRQRAELTHLSRVTMLGELSGSMAHELNQPLTAILSNAQAAQRFLALDQPDLGELRDILGDIVAQDKRAGEVIRRLRLLLKKGEVQRHPLSVNEVVQEVLRLVRSDLVSQNFSAHTELMAGLPLVDGDGVQLQQVLLNLVMNACEAMVGVEKDARQLTIRTKRSEDGSVHVSVIDCGPGIAPDKLEQVFESFYTTKAQGMGLGLAVCRSIITAHHGKMWATNNPSRGTAFHFTLPAIDREGRGSGGEGRGEALSVISNE